MKHPWRAATRERKREDRTVFDLGQIVATPGALEALQRASQAPANFLRRHVSGDWGDVNGHDSKANWIAVREGDRILSSYKTRLGDTIWLITESDRSVTTFLLPDEY
jgi:hypothetical protein